MDKSQITTQSDLDTLTAEEFICDEKGCQIVHKENWGADIKANDITNNPQPNIFKVTNRNNINIYHKSGTVENKVYLFCKKYKLSVRSTMSLLSFVSVILCGIVIAGVADFLMQNAIFSIVDSVGVFGVNK